MSFKRIKTTIFSLLIEFLRLYANDLFSLGPFWWCIAINYKKYEKIVHD